MLDESVPESTTFFLDTCFIRNSNLSQAFWNSLFRKSVVVTEAIWRELQPWITSPANNRNEWLRMYLSHERASSTGNLLFLGSFDDADVEQGCQYYKSVLSARKQVHILAERHLHRKHKRPPTKEEIQSEIQSRVKERGIQLANDGIKGEARNSANIYNDEDLVTRAIIYGLSSGNEVVILTTDRGVQEQFYKLLYLIDTNYRSMLAAEKFAEQPANFVSFQSDPDVFSFFGLVSSTQVSPPIDFARGVLPTQFTSVMLACPRFGTVYSNNVRYWDIAFSAEREMLEVVKIKGMTNGLNTTLLDGKNFIHHLCPAIPLDGICIIAIEKSITTKRMSIADYNIVLFQGERTSHFETLEPRTADQTDSEALLRSKSLIDFTPDRRLSFTPVPTVSDYLSNRELEYAFRLVKPSALFVLDSTAIGYKWPEAIANSLSSSQFLAIHSLHREHLSKANCFEKSNVHWPVNAVECPQFSYAARYYRTLLLQRRMFGSNIARRMSDNNGLAWRRTMLEFVNGKSSIRRARFGWKRRSAISVFYDDIAIVDGVLAAIIEGTELIFVTFRTSVFEQFYTLANVLLKNYYSYCLADSLFRDGARFTAPENTDQLREIGLDSEIRISSVDTDISAHLPKSPEKFKLSCWLLSPSCDENRFNFCHGCFLAERPMWLVLHTKTETSGLNSQHHGEYNVRAKTDRKRTSIMIAKDQVGSVDSIMPDIPEKIRRFFLDEVSLHDIFDVQNFGDPLSFPW